MQRQRQGQLPLEPLVRSPWLLWHEEPDWAYARHMPLHPSFPPCNTVFDSRPALQGEALAKASWASGGGRGGQAWVLAGAHLRMLWDSEAWRRKPGRFSDASCQRPRGSCRLTLFR